MNGKKISNPSSTGGFGGHFEAHVQSSYVALMLTEGYAPCLPCWPIAEIKLQGKIDGFDTDDLIVIVKNPENNEKRKLLGQVKSTIAITKGSPKFGEVIKAAWDDFNNPKFFTKGKDIIALITGPLSATDTHNVKWLLDQAKHTKDVYEFFRNVKQANFSPPKSQEKLKAIQLHLKAANNCNDISIDELYSFLNHFHLIGYDLGKEYGVVLSLLHSHISQFHKKNPQWVWSRIVDIVQTWNQDAGTIIPDKLPEDLLEAFKKKTIMEMPEELMVAQAPQNKKTNWGEHPNAAYLALAILIGSWNEKRESDVEVVTQIIGISYDEWLRKATEILHLSDSPLSLKNGIWKVVNRANLLDSIGSHILDQNLEIFKSLAISILSEPDPAFDLPIEERYSASIHGKVLCYSHVLRKGVAEGLALVGSFPDLLSNCSQGKAETICALALRKILVNDNCVIWGSLNNLLPTISEASPDEFLNLVERALHHTPCLYTELYSQESTGITGDNYITGLLWALEGLAWNEQYFVRVCVALGELANIDPGGQSGNRPFNSLTTILLPWLPQTLASVDKRKIAVKTLIRECPDVAWNLIINLLPNSHQISHGSHKPIWRKIIHDDLDKGVSHEEYWQQVSFYAEVSVSTAGNNIDRLCTLIKNFDKLPEPAFDQLVKVLSSQQISELPEEQKLSIWGQLTKLINRHRHFSGAKWALSDELITIIEGVTEQYAPTDPFYQYQYYFNNEDYDFYDENVDWKEQMKKYDDQREKAISEIYRLKGIKGVIQFADSVSSPFQVGQALVNIEDEILEQTFLPFFLDTMENNHKALVRGFISQRYYSKKWEWCDNIDKSGWTSEQIGQFLICLPFIKETWDRASEWLEGNESEYWINANANVYNVDVDITIATKNLIKYGRPHAAIKCLYYRIRHAKYTVETNLCFQALFAALSYNVEQKYDMDGYHIVELIKFLQEDPSVNEDDLFKVEWAYLRLLDGNMGATPQLLESKLANNPEFFCEVIQLIYRSNKENKPLKKTTEETKAIATNAWWLLNKWKTPPGIQKDGTFKEESFKEWLQNVKKICKESGHLDVALVRIGEVLIHAPSDPDGLWIHRVVADALNDREAEYMRDGFSTGTYNSRGVHWVDPTGKPERELAEQFRTKAEQIENEGFHRFAVTLREVANGYERDSKRYL